MQPHQLRKLVRKWTLLVLSLAVVGAGAAYGVSKALTPTFASKGDILVIAGPAESATAISLNATEITTTAATLITDPSLLAQVIKELKLTSTVDELAKRVQAAPQSNTELVDVTARDPDPVQAARIVNQLMNDYVNKVTEANASRINQAGGALQNQITQVQNALKDEEQQLASAPPNADSTALRASISANTALLSQLTTNYSSFQATQSQNLETVSVASPATPPTQPASPRVSLNTLLGAFAGLVVGLGIATLLEFLDQGLKTPDDVRDRLGLPCVGVVPTYPVVDPAKASPRQRRAMRAANEAYRRLRTNVLFSSPDTQLRTVALTSTRAGEGKTRTAANLAIALAGSDKRVLLVDADMRRPRQHKIFNKSLENGLSDLVVAATNDGGVDLDRTRVKEHPNLSLISSGTPPPNPSELLSSRRAQLLFHTLESQFDMLVVDTPPVGVVTDALTVAANASVTLLVVEAGRTNAGEAASVLEALRSVGANVVGVVLNQSKLRAGGSYYYYAYGYEENTPGGRGGRRRRKHSQAPTGVSEGPGARAPATEPAPIG